MRKLWGLLAGLVFASCSKKGDTLIRFELEETGSYAVQYREADGTFTVMDSLDIIGNDVFEVAFDTLQMISFLPFRRRITGGTCRSWI